MKCKLCNKSFFKLNKLRNYKSNFHVEYMLKEIKKHLYKASKLIDNWNLYFFYLLCI